MDPEQYQEQDRKNKQYPLSPNREADTESFGDPQ